LRGAGERRVAEHLRRGWREAWQIDTLTGDDAYALEQAVITWWRETLGAPAHYRAEHMPQSGATETVAWDVSPPSAVLDIVLAIAEAASLVIELRSPTSVGVDIRPSSAAGPLAAEPDESKLKSRGPLPI
jgi:hypothetical protein